MSRERVIVVDYGGQYTHLIARRCRELGVYSEIVPQNASLAATDMDGVKGVILSGGPRTVSKEDLGEVFQDNLALLKKTGRPVLGICFGHQLLAVAHGAALTSGENREYGSTTIRILDRSSILKGLDQVQTVWMSHGDEVRSLPPTLKALAVSGEDHVSAYSSVDGMVYGVQFHPEVTHTPRGREVLRAFLRDICGYLGEYNPESMIDDILVEIRKQVGDGRVIMATSGGVDSTVAATLLQRAIGDQLACVFVDNGLLREGEREEVESVYRGLNFSHFYVVDAGEEFLHALEGIEDPEEKRRVIGETFIRVFERTASELKSKFGQFDFLGQGTIYPDRVESAATGKSTAVIKSHHNVRLPKWMKLRVVEPLKDLYKDEVRRLGTALGIPDKLIRRQPFPGPSLAIRMG
ncbi:MAG: glutamine-hydrolyzing GMP synthase, partial [Candidatus Thorarchaeota archaeon]|nr:glutamine-hydrolyzing GMP synthase [Candidatus Thorarchaeota archaeon]